MRIHRCNDLKGRKQAEGSENYVAYDFGKSGGGERRGCVYGDRRGDGGGSGDADPEGKITIPMKQGEGSESDVSVRYSSCGAGGERNGGLHDRGDRGSGSDVPACAEGKISFKAQKQKRRIFVSVRSDN